MSAETTLPLTGGCGCGRVRFEVSAPPLSAAYCHCTRCQRRTGTAASPNARVEPGSARVVAGEQELHSWVPEGGLPKAFCAGCGSALFALSADDGSIVSVRLGAFDGDPGVRPSAHHFVAYAASWEQIPEDGLPRHPEARPS